MKCWRDQKLSLVGKELLINPLKMMTYLYLYSTHNHLSPENLYYVNTPQYMSRSLRAYWTSLFQSKTTLPVYLLLLRRNLRLLACISLDYFLIRLFDILLVPFRRFWLLYTRCQSKKGPSLIWVISWRSDKSPQNSQFSFGSRN